MDAASASWNWGIVAPADWEQLAPLLPFEAKNLLSSPEKLSAQDLHTLYAHLERLWTTTRAMAPRWIVDSLAQLDSIPIRSSEATLLFADVTGFTSLTSQLELLGRIGKEHITSALNRFFGAIIPIAIAYGGDLLAFGGDAILVAFDGANHAMRGAIAAWDMQQALAGRDKRELEHPASLSLRMKIGIASGPLVLASGGTARRRVALPLGSVLDTTDAMASATGPGQIRLDARAAAYSTPITILRPQPDGSALLEGFHERLPAQERHPIASSLQIGDLAAQIVALARYLPQSVIASISAAPHTTPGQGEQRYVVNLFSHLLGLHKLADRFGASEPHVVADAVDLVFNRAISIIEGYQGVLARVDVYPEGHKLLALFGAPVAHEQEAARAIEAALALRDALPQLNAEIVAALGARASAVADARSVEPVLRLRSGINAGPVVAGVVGSPLRWEYTVTGDAVNVGARLMSNAGPGEVLAGSSVSAVTERYLDAETRMLLLKGKSKPIAAAAIHALRYAERSSPAEPLPLIGRENEQGAFRRAGAALRAQQPHLIFVQGEAGIGKSRLVRELPALLGEAVLCVQTEPPGLVPVSFSMFRAFLTALCRTALEISSLDGEQLHSAIEHLCPAQYAELRPALAMLLGAPEADIAAIGATAEAQQQILARAVQTVLETMAARRPLAWICEDLHEGDDSSLAVLEQLLTIGWSAPALLCLTARTTTPQIVQRLLGAAAQPFRNNLITINLIGISPSASDSLLDALLPGLAPATRASLHAYASGNPLFLQVLVQMVRQQRILTSSSLGLTLRVSLASLNVPRTLRELVAAQVDRLPAEVRRLAQEAAVIAAADRSIPLWLIEQIVEDPHAMHLRLHRLEQEQVIAPEATSSAQHYAFRHALYQQAAYDQLLERERQDLHRRAGLALHSRRDRHDAQIEALAYHCYEGRCWDLALDYSLAAGERALRSYANRDARRALRRALGLARRLGRLDREAGAREGLGELYTLTGRYLAARAHLERILQQPAAGEPEPTLIEAQARRHRLLAEIGESLGEYDRAEQESRIGLALARKLPRNTREIGRAHEQLAIVLMRRGRLDEAEQICRDGLLLLPQAASLLRERAALMQLIGDFDLQRGHHHAAIPMLEESLTLARDLSDPTLTPPILRNLGLGYYLIGQRARAQECYQESIGIDERIGNVGGIITANDNLGLVHLMNGEYTTALECFQKALQLSQTHLMTQRLANVTTNLGLLYFVTADLNRAETTLRQAHDLFSELGDARSLADCLYQMGDVALAQGKNEAAHAYGEQTITLARQVGSILYEAYGLRVVGEALLAHDRLVDADDALERAQQVQQRIDDPFGQILLWRALALLESARGRRHEAARLAQIGLEAAQAQATPYLIAALQKLA